jgi:hypothetical protein
VVQAEAVPAAIAEVVADPVAAQVAIVVLGANEF